MHYRGQGHVCYDHVGDLTAPCAWDYEEDDSAALFNAIPSQKSDHRSNCGYDLAHTRGFNAPIIGHDAGIWRIW
jgi:hypothetical protein